MTNPTEQLEAFENEHPFLVQSLWRRHPDGYAAADAACLAACRAALAPRRPVRARSLTALGLSISCNLFLPGAVLLV